MNFTKNIKGNKYVSHLQLLTYILPIVDRNDVPCQFNLIDSLMYSVEERLIPPQYHTHSPWKCLNLSRHKMVFLATSQRKHPNLS